jgi:TPP-dependent pyruvate/acetoin dehydrogenase alpha subunit
MEPRPPEIVEEFKKRDPILTFGQKLLEQKILTEDDIKKIDAELQAEAEAMDKEATEGPMPDPAVLEKALYAE